MGGPTPLREPPPRPYAAWSSSGRGLWWDFLAGRRGWVCGETHGDLWRPMETYGDLRREVKRLPLYDFRYSSRLSWEEILDYQSSSTWLLSSKSPLTNPKYSGTIRGSRRACYRFFRLSWETSSHSRVLFTWLLVYMATCFFSDDVLWRNYFIKRVELFELSSIHGTISRESTFHLYFVKVESGFSRNDRNLSR